MQSSWMERVSGFVCNLLLLTMSLALMVAYGFLFKVFRPDQIEVRPVEVQQQSDDRADDQWSYVDPES
ncbi:hypothetical protein [Luteolibacter marinus]|uniref:hypothetical protein n=1 Tax=Luteolibacter marinus TaxID=2776705 RepID=UPI0018692B54|nr:hypothetical protein [Luteolibacter marinus]